MLQGPGRPAIILYHHHIESAGAISNTMLGKILCGQLNQLRALAGIDRFDGAAERPRSPPFDFDEDEHPPIIGDEVQPGALGGRERLFRLRQGFIKPQTFADDDQAGVKSRPEICDALA